MTQKTPKVSVIIPVYNEEDRMYDCLWAITHQVEKPFEIIVVDNNSRDQTVAIARRFKGVKVVTETKQGLTNARNRGFEEAEGDILARIDADTMVPADWVKKVREAFDLDPELAGLTGYGRTRAGVTIPLFSDIWSWAYFTHTKAFFGHTMLWGANMAVRKSAWLKANKLCCLDDSHVHEDQDLSLALAATGARVKIDPTLTVSVDFGDIQYIEKFWVYYRKKHHTRAIHQLHYRSKLVTNQPLPLYKRIGYHMAASYTVGFFMVFTSLNSARRELLEASKQSSVYFWYQKIKSDLEI
jgi:glycosyltransferase involved in cell wall biosynthesis